MRRDAVFAEFGGKFLETIGPTTFWEADRKTCQPGGWATLTLADIQKTILDGVAAWWHGPLAADVSLVIVEVR
jgi:hypothetical protein